MKKKAGVCMKSATQSGENEGKLLKEPSQADERQPKMAENEGSEAEDLS